MSSRRKKITIAIIVIGLILILLCAKWILSKGAASEDGDTQKGPEVVLDTDTETEADGDSNSNASENAEQNDDGMDVFDQDASSSDTKKSSGSSSGSGKKKSSSGGGSQNQDASEETNGTGGEESTGVETPIIPID